MAVTRTTELTELAGDPFGGIISKKLSTLGAVETVLVWMIYSDKLPPIPGGIMLTGLAGLYMISQGAVDFMKEKNRGLAGKVTTTLATAVSVLPTAPPVPLEPEA